MRATLVQRGWLRRTLEVAMADGMHIVEYNGTGLRYEQVTADGGVIRIPTFWWYAPRFDFKLSGWPSVVEVRVWPWLTLRSFALLVNGQGVYAESLSDECMKAAGLSSDWCDLA